MGILSKKALPATAMHRLVDARDRRLVVVRTVGATVAATVAGLIANVLR